MATKAARARKTPSKTKQGEAKRAKETVKRDSFSMPMADYELIEVIQDRCLKQSKYFNKSEILRVALRTLNSLSDSALLRNMKALEKLRRGRPPIDEGS